jgi:uncharacterized membrane protein YozB (DUF420 family)
MNLSNFPPLIASLNALSALLLLSGYAFIKNKKLLAHKACMGLAFLSSIVFLACYLYYHAQVGVMHFTGQGWVRPVYFFILFTHTVLAAIVPILAVWTLFRALRGEYEKHRRIARVTFPIWLYVSVTGVVVYWMLYVLYQPAVSV